MGIFLPDMLAVDVVAISPLRLPINRVLLQRPSGHVIRLEKEYFYPTTESCVFSSLDQFCPIPMQKGILPFKNKNYRFSGYIKAE
jgi:hypothetical protein